MKRIVLTLTFLVLVSCVSPPTPQEIASADYGRFPTHYEKIVKQYYSLILKDPDSVKYRAITYPKRYYLGTRLQETKFGYLVCVTINAKNSYGAYTGYKTDGLLMRNGQIVQHVEAVHRHPNLVC